LILGVGWLLGREPTRTSAVTAAVIAALLLMLVAGRAPGYLPAVATVFVILFAALFWRPRASWSSAHRIAIVGLLMGAFYIGSLLLLHSLTVSRVRVELDRRGLTSVEELMVGPTPANPLAWSVVIGQGETYRYGRFSWKAREPLQLAQVELPAARSSSLWDEITTSGQSVGFLRWARFPWLELEADERVHRVHLMDARYRRSRATGFGATTIDLGTD